MNAVVPTPTVNQFTFHFGNVPIRGIGDGETAVFVAQDVAQALHYRDAANMNRILKEREKGTHSVSTPGGVQRMSTITEPGLYRAIMQRKVTVDDKDVVMRRAIEAFQDWVLHDVLPALRTKGTYAVAPVPAPVPVDPFEYLSNPHNVMAIIGGYAQRNIALEAKVAEQAPMVAALDRISNADGTRCISDTAKRLGMKPNALFAYMRDPYAKMRWLFQRHAGGEDVAMQDRLDAGDLVVKVKVFRRPDGTDKLITYIHVTPLGFTRLATLFAPRLPGVG